MVAPLITLGSLLICLLHNNHGLDLSKSCKSASWESSCNLEFGWIGCCSPTENPMSFATQRSEWSFNCVPRVRWRPGEFDVFCLSGCIYTLKLLVIYIYKYTLIFTYTLPETNSSHLKIDPYKKYPASFWGPAYFSGGKC